MRVIFAQANFGLPLVAVDVTEKGEVTPFDRVSRFQLVRGVEGRKMFDPVILYLGFDEENLDLDEAISVLRSDTLAIPETAPSIPLMMELETSEFWAAVAYLSVDVPEGEEVVLVLPDGISQSTLDGLTPKRAMRLSKDGKPDKEIPEPRIVPQGEVLLWDWFVNVPKDQLGADINEARIEPGNEVLVAILLSGSDDGFKVLSRYRVAAVNAELDTHLTIAREGEPLSIEDAEGEIDGAWDQLIAALEFGEDGSLSLDEGVSLALGSGLRKWRMMQPKVAEEGGE
jgi:hypothetical protein